MNVENNAYLLIPDPLLNFRSILIIAISLSLPDISASVLIVSRLIKMATDNRGVMVYLPSEVEVKMSDIVLQQVPIE